MTTNKAPVDPTPEPLAYRSGVGGGATALTAGVGVLILIGAFTPFVETSGVTSRVATGFGVTAAVVCGLLALIGGVTAQSARLALIVAAGAATTFVGLFAVTLSNVLSSLDLANEFGSDFAPHVGFYAWCLAGVGALVLAGLGLAGISGTTGSPWPYLIAAAGLALFWVGLVVPPKGLSLGDYLFFGDTGMDAAIVVLLAGLPLAAVLLVAARTQASGAFALGAAAPWAASWLVFALDGSSGGLPAPWLDQPLIGAAAVGLASASVVGAFWWGVSGSTLAATGGTAALTGAQVVVVVVCGASVAAAAAGGIAAEPISSGYSLGANVGGVGSGGSVYGAVGDDADTDEFSADDEFEQDVDSGSSGGSTGADADESDVVTTECVEVRCEDDPVESDAAVASSLLVPVEASATGQRDSLTLCTGEPVDYTASNLIDGSFESGWGVAGNGVGHSITVDFGGPVRLTEVGLTPGYVKVGPRRDTNCTPADAFPKNHFIESVRYEFDDGTSVTQFFDRVASMQTMAVDAETSTVTIIITETDRPPGADDDTIISEAEFYGVSS